MAIALSHQEVLEQSIAVFTQFGDKWKEHCAFNSKLQSSDPYKLNNIGIGKFLVLAAMGESLEMNFETIKKYRDRIDLVANDKSFGKLIEHGITPDYVMLCDANIPFRFLEPYVKETAGVKLISTVYGNPEWTSVWKGERFFYINQDSINSEAVFAPMWGRRTRMIPAGSNVSNAMVIFFTGSNNEQNINFSGYEKFYLVGYDYSWRRTGNYYAWENPQPKRNYMNHRSILDLNADPVYTSENLLFSAKWLFSYITTFRLPVINCSGRGLLNIAVGDLEKELKKINPDKKIQSKIKELFEMANQAYQTSVKSREIFDKAREELYGNW